MLLLKLKLPGWQCYGLRESHLADLGAPRPARLLFICRSAALLARYPVPIRPSPPAQAHPRPKCRAQPLL